MTTQSESITPNFSTRKLGKRPARNDPRTLKFARYWTGNLEALPPIPARANNLVAAGYPADGNTKYGNCVECAMLHLSETWRSEAGHPLQFTEADGIRLYTEITGFNPNNPATDQGTDMTAALNYWRTTGIRFPDGSRHTIGAYVAVDIRNQAEVDAAIYLFGGLFIGVGLPVSAQTQSVWSVVGDGRSGNSAPYSWGGHCVPPMTFDSAMTLFPTWGEELGSTFGFLDTYCDEAFAILSRDQLTDSGLSALGFDITALTSDLAIVGGQPDPTPQPQPVVDPAVAQWLDWQAAVADYVRSAYEGGDVASARTWQATLGQYAAGITALVTGQRAPRARKLPHALPTRPA